MTKFPRESVSIGRSQTSFIALDSAVSQPSTRQCHSRTSNPIGQLPLANVGSVSCGTCVPPFDTQMIVRLLCGDRSATGAVGDATVHAFAAMRLATITSRRAKRTTYTSGPRPVNLPDE